MPGIDDTSSGRFAEAVQTLLRTGALGRNIRHVSETTSTNTLAAEWGAAGAPEGAVVVADFQTAGRGRLGRTWLAAPGENATFSVVLRPGLPPERLGLLTLAASLGVAEAVGDAAPGLAPRIKWPNDIYVQNRKCCGMLLESSLGAGADVRAAVVILGIGLNVNQTRFAPELARTAISLRLASGREVSRAAVLAAVLNRFEPWYAALREGRMEGITQAYEERMLGLGGPMTLHYVGTDRVFTGIARGVTAEGALRLETPTGEHTFISGEVTTHAPGA